MGWLQHVITRHWLVSSQVLMNTRPDIHMTSPWRVWEVVRASHSGHRVWLYWSRAHNKCKPLTSLVAIGHHCTISSIKQNSVLFIHGVKPHLCDMCHESFTNLNDFHPHGETYTHKDKLVIGNLIYAICAGKIFTDKETLCSHKEPHGFIEQRKSEKVHRKNARRKHGTETSTVWCEFISMQNCG